MSTEKKEKVYEIAEYKAESERFDLDQRKAKAYGSSLMIPQHLRDIGSMMILNQMSRDFDLPMLTLAQQIFMVKGKVGMSGQLVVSLINKSESVDHGMRWEIENEGTPQWRVRAWNTMDGEKIFGEWISDADVTAFGWKSNPLWVKMPIRMAKYRTATYWGRDYAPDVLMGLSDKDEIIDVVIDTPETHEKAGTLNSAVSEVNDVSEEAQIITMTDDIEADHELLFERLKDQAGQLGVRFRRDISYESLFKKVEDFKRESDEYDHSMSDGGQGTFEDLEPRVSCDATVSYPQD